MKRKPLNLTYKMIIEKKNIHLFQSFTVHISHSSQELLYSLLLVSSYSGLIITVPPLVIFLNKQKQNIKLIWFKQKENSRETTYFKNWGRKEFQPAVDCLNVRYNSKVEAVEGSHFTVLSFLQSSSPSKAR